MGLIYACTPIGALTQLSLGQRAAYFVKTVDLPLHLRDMLLELNTGSFLRGLAKEFRLSVDQVPHIALAVLRVAVGEIELAKLGAVLSAELKLPNDKAQAIAKEIEKELFAPVMLELQEFLEKRKMKKENSEDKAKQSGAQNIVNLKQPPRQSAQPSSSALSKPGQFTQ